MASVRAFVPRPRRHGLVRQELDGELLLYVEETHQASSLNASARRIWDLCDGIRPVQAIAADAKLTDGAVFNSVKQFSEAGLLENGADLPRVDVLRRQALISVGLATPVILIILTPRAAAAASCAPPGPCTLGQVCCSGGTCAANGGICPP